MIKYIQNTPNYIHLECWEHDTHILTASITIFGNVASWSDQFYGKMSKTILKTMKHDFEQFVQMLKDRGIEYITIQVTAADLAQGETLRKIFKFPEYTPYYVSVRKI